MITKEHDQTYGDFTHTVCASKLQFKNSFVTNQYESINLETYRNWSFQGDPERKFYKKKETVFILYFALLRHLVLAENQIRITCDSYTIIMTVQWEKILLGMDW